MTSLEEPQRRLESKIALVTGGGSGIGAAAVLAFARAGATVVLAGRRADELEAISEQVRRAEGEAIAVPTDLTDDGAVRDLIAGIVERFGRIDVAFNNAGTLGTMKPITELDVSDYDAVMAVNLRAVWLLLKYEVAAMLRAGSGAIVNTSSFVAQAATPGTSIYAASKGALEAMVRAVALEFGPHGIRVNTSHRG